MAIITDEQMKELSDIVGRAYIQEQDAIGDLNTPGSMMYENQKLINYTNGEAAENGILSGCAATAGTNTITVADGVVVYDYNQYNFLSYVVSISKTFQYPFDGSYQYGFVVVFNRADLAATALSYRTKLTTSVVANTDIYLELDDVTLLSSYTPPFHITIGSEDILIWSIDTVNSRALIAPNYNNGAVVSSHSAGAITFVSKPLVPQIIFGLPVSATYQSGGDPSTFQYYPPISEVDYIIISRGLVTNPNTVDVPRTPSIVNIEDMRTFIDVPAVDLFTSTEKVSIQTAANSVLYTLTSISTSGSSVAVINALREFSSVETGADFATYWNNRPFVSQSNFLRGESFNGITRFEFSDDFKDAHYRLYGQELLNTFSIFRGDIFGGTATFGSPPAGLSGTYASVVSYLQGNLSYGTWIYRVTAVTVSGETSPSQAVSVVIPASSGPLNRVDLTWTAVVGALYYHVYRMGMSGVNFLEHRLTTAGALITNSYSDFGNTSGLTVNRGVWFTGNRVVNPVQLQVYVPPTSGNLNLFIAGQGLNPSFTQDTTIQNEVVLTIYGIKSDNTIGTAQTVTVPRGTARSTKFAVGTLNDLYIGVYDVTIAPGVDLNMQAGAIMWSPYDLITVQNV